jgi:hypothetical protein
MVHEPDPLSITSHRLSRSVVSMAIVLVWAFPFVADTPGAPGSVTSASSLTVSAPIRDVANGCQGVHVDGDVDLATAMDAHPPGTTYCLGPGTFSITSTIATEPGARGIGAGRDTTFIDGTGLATTAPGIFETNDATYFADLDISGAPTPQAGSGIFCSPGRANCGRAFIASGSSLTIQSIDCHDNGAACVAGGGNTDVVADDIDCWGNGSGYSMTPAFRSAACIKRVAIYEPGGDTTVTNSFIHDNAWVGLWCDFCKRGLFDVEHNRIVDNGSNGVQWEMSGGWSSDDRAIVRSNAFRGNNRLENPEAGGIGISTANDITVSDNTFDANHVAAVNVIFTASRHPPLPDSRGVVIEDNALNGDAVLGCDRAPLPFRIALLLGFSLGLRVAFGLGLLLTLCVLAILVHASRRRVVIFGLPLVLVLVSLGLPVVLHLGVTCANNV